MTTPPRTKLDEWEDLAKRAYPHAKLLHGDDLLVMVRALRAAQDQRYADFDAAMAELLKETT